LQKKKFRKLLPFFLGGWIGGQESNVLAEVGRIFLQVLNLYIWRRNDWQKAGLSFSKKFYETSYQFSLADGNAAGGPTSIPLQGIYFLNF
jgi:hypothetical protein